ncbi:MAG: hypothetical protein SWO11_10215 [Thermodesulfobacteriota bacterium]|nr:hypothetical protein [Thermodesulfobacteriota bacterium]
MIFKKYDLKDPPLEIRKHFTMSVQDQMHEMPKKDDPIFEHVFNIIVGSSILALEVERDKAEVLSYKTLIFSSMLEGETREVIRIHSAIAKEILKTGRPIEIPVCIISGDEISVAIQGKVLGTGIWNSVL